jgi:hypothetical protein
MAFFAKTYLLPHFLDGFGKQKSLFFGLLKHVQGKPQCGTLAYTGQLGYFGHCPFQ